MRNTSSRTPQGNVTFSCDVELVRLAEKNPIYQNKILSKIYPRVCQVVYMVVPKNAESEDLIQICLIEVLEHLYNYRGEGTVESWAGRVAHRVVMRELKKTQQRSHRFRTMLWTNDDVVKETPEKTISRRQWWDQLTKKLETIPTKRRAVLSMHLIYEYTIPEIAELSNVSANTVKDHLKTAYRELRTILTCNATLREAIRDLNRE